MKKIPFVPKFAPALGAQFVQRPFRLWMTGSLAVVMAAMIPMRQAGSMSERSHLMRVLRHSRYDVSETLSRIEVAARDRGLSVLARVPGAQSVLVLASSIGGTLVVMDRPDSEPSIPLSLMIHSSREGGADVLIGSMHSADAWSELPTAVVDDLRALPGVVERALA